MKKLLQSTFLLIFISFSAFSQSNETLFFEEANSFFATYANNNLVNYTELQSNAQLKKLINLIEEIDISNQSDEVKKAYYINAYNLLVINKAVEAFPINSVLDDPGFFDSDKITIGNEKMTLNQLEKDFLLNKYGDARYHFVLVCGALGCPPITNFAYRPDQLEAQLEQQTKLALNNPEFVRVNNGKVELSEIFKWYRSDFGNSDKQIIGYINRYRDNPLPENTNYTYYNYDWSLNDFSKSVQVVEGESQLATNQSRYIVSSTIPKGTAEIKIFNNLYSEQKNSDGNRLTDRSSFFTSSLTALYGISHNFNIGLSARYRRVRNNPLPSSPFSVFGSGEVGSTRSGLTGIGPMIRYAPVPKWQNFSIQSQFLLPIGNDLSGNESLPFIEWSGPIWITQFFNDFSIGNKFSLFTEIDFIIEDIGNSAEGHVNRTSTPVTLIFSYVPTTKIVLYALGGYSPFWQQDFDYFRQFGIGSKYQFTPNLELELLYTNFSNEFLAQSGGRAETINVGFRFNLR